VAVPGRAEALVLPHGAPLADLRDALLAGAGVTVCGQCAARRDLGPEDLLEPAVIRGAAAYVEEILRPDVQAVVY
jgi:predicted peroxiredoxin